MCNAIKLFDILDLFCPFCKRNIGLVMNHWTISIDAMCFNTEYCLETTSFFDFFLFVLIISVYIHGIQEYINCKISTFQI